MLLRRLMRAGATLWRRREGAASGFPRARAERLQGGGSVAVCARLAARGRALEDQAVFVHREPVLTRRGRIAGYVFSLLASDPLLEEGAADDALLARLTQQKGGSLLGRRLAFIPLSIQSLSSLRLCQLSPKNTVLVVKLNDSAAELARLPARLAHLREAGFLTGMLLDRQIELADTLVAQLDFVWLDSAAYNGLDLRVLSRALRAFPRPERRALYLAACHVKSHDEFHLCRKCSFDYFQGCFTSMRESVRPTSSKINRMLLLPILNMVLSDCSYGEIAAQLSCDQTMSYKLLRYINSAALGLQKPVESLTEALMHVGRDRFYRWTSLLLFDFSEPDFAQRLLAERALTRGRALELMAGKGLIPDDPGKLFLVGLFSLLDEVLGHPLSELLEQMALPDEVRDALLGRPGSYADALALAVLSEADSNTPLVAIAQALHRCGVDQKECLPAITQALVWANEVLEDAA